MRFDGTIKSWNDDRGFGFIAPARGGEDVFVHVKAFKPRAGRPVLNQRVSFDVELGADGRKRACNVEPYRPLRASASARREAPAPWSAGAIFAIPAFIVLYVLVARAWHPPIWVIGLYVATSIVTFLAYALDKSAAKYKRWRTSEQALHGLALIGGWPGALLAQQLLRHKATKASFRSAYWLVVAANIGAFVVLSSPLFRAALGSGLAR